jgi:hypothetical protein
MEYNILELCTLVKKTCGNVPTWLSQLERASMNWSQSATSECAPSHVLFCLEYLTMDSNLEVISEIQKRIVSHKAVKSMCYSEVSAEITYVKFWIKEFM